MHFVNLSFIAKLFFQSRWRLNFCKKNLKNCKDDKKIKGKNIHAKNTIKKTLHAYQSPILIENNDNEKTCTIDLIKTRSKIFEIKSSVQ